MGRNRELAGEGGSTLLATPFFRSEFEAPVNAAAHAGFRCKQKFFWPELTLVAEAASTRNQWLKRA
jgi:hypothetical protein